MSFGGTTYMSRPSSDGWWSTAFDADYLLTYVDIRTPEDTDREVKLKFISDVIPSGSKLLDVGCGYGRHALALAARGYRVVGVDRSEYLISVARKDAAAAERTTSPAYVIGDMRHLPFDSSFDAALSMFTSFGYFRTQHEDRLALQGIARSLAVGGKFLIDLNNPAAVENFIERRGGIRSKNRDIIQSRYFSRLSNGLELTITETLNQKTLLWSSTCSWLSGHTRKGYRTRVRLYSLDDLRKMLSTQGLSMASAWGAFDGAKFDPSRSPRLIVLAEKR